MPVYTLDFEINRLNRHGLDIVSVSEAFDCYDHVGRASTGVRIKTRAIGFRASTHTFIFDRSHLSVCDKCGAVHRPNNSIYGMPWYRRYNTMQSKYKAYLIRFERANLKPNQCRKCIAGYYVAFKVEYDNLEITQQIKNLGREIRCQSKQPET